MTKNDNRYVALIADAVASRTLAPRVRTKLQTDVRASLGDINRRGLGDRALDPAHVRRGGLGDRLWARSDHDPARPHRTRSGRPLLPCGTQRAGYRQARSLDLRLRRLRARSGRLRRLLLGPVLELDAASAAGGQLPALLRRYLGVAEARTEHGHSSNRAVPSAAPHGLAPRGGRG